MSTPTLSTETAAPAVLQEVGVQLFLNPGRTAVDVPKISAILETYSDVPVRQVSVKGVGAETHVVLAIGLGTPEEIAERGPRAVDAVRLINELLIEMSHCDASFVAIPMT